MTGDAATLTAVAMAVLDSEAEHAALLRSIVRTTQAIFGATASSISLLDRERGELVLEAVARDGEERLVGHRFPASAGIAGWVVAAGEAMVVDDLSGSTLFARDVAEATGYVPAALMAAPVIHDEEVLGVLEVMDYARPTTTALGAADLLWLFAGQAAVALAVVRRARAARRLLLDDVDGDHADVLAAVETLLRLDHRQRAAGLSLLGSVGDLLGAGD
jgi:GAF domain-containing protein